MWMWMICSSLCRKERTMYRILWIETYAKDVKQKMEQYKHSNILPLFHSKILSLNAVRLFRGLWLSSIFDVAFFKIGDITCSEGVLLDGLNLLFVPSAGPRSQLIYFSG